MNSQSFVPIVLLLAVAACSAPRAGSPAPSPAPARSTELPLSNDLKWVRASAEYRALARQAYGVAGERLAELARGLPAQGWAVILDADETVLDNSEYQRRREAMDTTYSPESWAEWVSERAAPAIAGSVDFTARIHSLGGRVVIVTNRSQSACDATRQNLKSDGIEADAVLCQPPGESDKNPRFARVQNGTAAPGIPALVVVAWVGDNILDFPALTQAVRKDSTALGVFGKKFFIIPNPMYGSWEKVK